MKLSELIRKHDFFVDYITFYEDAINLYLDDRLREVYGNRKLKKNLERFLGKFKERRVVFFPTDLASAPPFNIVLGRESYKFLFEYDEFKKGDILVKTDHVTMMSVGLRSISILRALVEERMDIYPFYPLLEKIRLARIFDLRIF